MSGATKLYAIFHTGNNPGKLTHKAYVTHVNPDRAIEMYIREHDADPNGLIALPISGNKFTFWRKKKRPNLNSRAEVLRSLDKRYTKARLYELPLPVEWLSWEEQFRGGHMKFQIKKYQ
jgi:hypothetical protein